MQDILALLKEALKVAQELLRIHLGRARFRAVDHRLVELVKGHGLAEIVQVVLPVQLIVETDVVDVPPLEVLLGEIGCGTAAQNIGHRRLRFMKYMDRTCLL